MAGDSLPGFRSRSESVSRLEGFSDSAFGFALTLLVVPSPSAAEVAGLFNFAAAHSKEAPAPFVGGARALAKARACSELVSRGGL